MGLLYQPTFFEPERALRQLEIEQPFIRQNHLETAIPISHLPLREGVIPWERIIPKLAARVAATLEFVPRGNLSS